MAASGEDKNRPAEFSLIDRLAGHMRVNRADVKLGIGDDAALIEIPAAEANRQLVTATDTLVEGTHFLPGAPPHSIGHRALAVNLSDFAAMGAEPAWASLSLSLPDTDAAWLDGFAVGFAALAETYQVQLIGGDTVRGPLSITVSLQGTVPAGQAVLRSGAKSGDVVFVTGMPGAAAAGRRLLEQSGDDEHLQGLRNKFLYPEPRVAFGAALRNLANAMIDISDGLQADLMHILNQSECGASLELDQLSLQAEISTWFSAEQALEFVLFGGEDYELLFTVSPGNVPAVTALGAQHGCGLTQLGEIKAAGIAWSLKGQQCKLADKTYEHFSG
jgi:thiamine-monophosphate kinase